MHEGCTLFPSLPFWIDSRWEDEAAAINISEMIEDHVRRDEWDDEDTSYRRYPFKGV
jgi:hypothetical protein